MSSISKPLFLWSFFILLCALVGIQQTLFQDEFPVETNILALLPDNQQDVIAQQAFQQIAENINNRVVFLLEGTDKDQLVLAAEHFSKQLPQLSLFSNIESQMADVEQQAWASLYFPYRAQLLAEQNKQQLQRNPEARVNHVIQQVYNPFSGVSGGELKSDPFLLFRDYLSSRNSSDGHFSLYQNYLLSEDQGHFYIVIQANLAGDAYDSQLQAKIPALQMLEDDVEQMFHMKLLHTGTIFYATYGTESAKSEIGTIGVGSLIGVVLLLLFVYRSTLPLVLALFSISCGLLVAFVVTILVFGKVHIFSLVFGASLIGVSIDYAFHYLTERLVNKDNWDARLALKHIFNAISLGLVTSLIGYLGLLIAPFPGLQQLSLFSVVGLISAYLTVVLCYPALTKKPSKTNVPNLAVLNLWLRLWENSTVRIAVPSVLVVLALVGLTQITFDDDIRQLQAMPSDLKTQEQQIKSITGVGQQQTLLLVKADNEELLLQRLEQLSTQFKQWKAAGDLKNVQLISQFVPSIKRQKANYQQIASLYQHQGEALAKKLNFSDPISFDATFKPLLIEQYLNSAVSKPLGFLWLGQIAGKTVSVVVLSDVQNPQLIENLLNNNADLSVLDKASEISAIFANYRLFISEMLAAAYFAIALLLLWRYGAKLAFKVLTPPFIAGLVALAITVVFAIPITIFNLLALLLVLGIGIDYTLFFAEQKAHTKSENTLLAITLSAITTVLSFGLLALSETQAIHGFGVTVFTGIVVAWLLAPLAMQTEQRCAQKNTGKGN
jgi:predicted exporter